MKLAFLEAEKVQGLTFPNPNVGAVIVNNGKIVGLGNTQPAGFDHAEIQALKMAGEFSKNAKIFVTLEPCCHYGKTPPCTEAIIKAGISEVYVGILDPNPLVSGKGIQILKESGIKVEHGFLENDISNQLNGFLTRITNNRPYFFAKQAITLDGKVSCSNGDSKWISSEESRCKVHEYRQSADAILTGINTVLADDCMLNVRLANKYRDPHRIILDPELLISQDSKIVNSANEIPTYIITGSSDLKKIKILERKNVSIVMLSLNSSKLLNLDDVSHWCFNYGFNKIMIETGSLLLNSFIKAKLLDEIIIHQAPKVVGGKKGWFSSEIEFMKDSQNLEITSLKQIGNDIEIKAKFIWE